MRQRNPRTPDTPQAPSVLRNINFDRLWAAQVLSQIAQNLLNFALIIRVFQLAQGTRLANVSVALLILSFGIPSIFFAAAAGVYVDHWNKKLVLVVANFLRAILVLGYLVFEQNLAMVLLLSFFISAATQFFTPAEAASIPALVSKPQLLRANSLFVFTMYASFIVGYSASAPVISSLGTSGPYYVTALMFLLAGILVSFLPSIGRHTSSRVPFMKVVRHTGSEIRRNWQVIRSNHNLSLPIIWLTITQTSLGVLLALAPALALAVLGTPIENSSHYLIIPAGLGMVLGVTFIGQLAKYLSKIRLIIIGLMIASIALVLLGIVNKTHLPQVGPFVASMVLILGFMNAVVSAAAQTLLQEHTTDSTRGKVFGALSMMVNIAATLPIFFAGIIADLTSVTSVVIALGIAVLAFAIAQYLWLVRRHNIIR